MKVFKFLFLLMCLCFVGCTTPVEEPEEKPKENEEKVLNEICLEYTVLEQETFFLDLNVKNFVVTYTTSDLEIIKLEENKVTCLKPGTAIVNVVCENEEQQITINVIGKPGIEVLETEYTIKQTEKINITYILKNTEIIPTFSTNSNYIKLNENEVEGISVGDAIVKLTWGSESFDITIHVVPNKYFEIENIIEIYVEEKKNLDINIINGNINDVTIKTKSNIIEIVDNVYVYGLTEGICEVEVTLGDQTEIVQVTVKNLDVEILNGDIELDYFDTATLEINYPTHTEMELQYVFFKEGIIKIIDNVVIPLTTGETKVRIQLGDDRKISDTITIKITVDPIELIKNANIEEILMKKEVTTYGAYDKKQAVMGGVSYYYYGDLNLVLDILDIYENEYVGQTATPEILAIAEGLKLPRSGIKLEEIKYITYHDTGNNTAGAAAEGNVSYMKSQDSLDYRARSWHYTVDCNKVIQTIPDDEVTWQGDTYGAYATSIGIETCVDFGSKLNVTWQRMGKLCGLLMTKYGLDMTCIKQHYDWNGKECPQTLRRNNLYSYALKMIETEWLFKKLLTDYTITFESISPEYLDNTGQIILEPTMPITVSYRVTVTNKTGYNESIELKSLCNPLS